MPILTNKKQYRQADDSFLDKLSQSMDYVGDISGITINLGKNFSPARKIIPFMESNKVYLVTGHQRGDLIGIDPSDIIITDRYKTANQVGTLAWGYFNSEGQRYTIRIVCWDDERQDFALVASNELKGETRAAYLLDNVDTNILRRATSNLEQLRKKAIAARENFDPNDVELSQFFKSPSEQAGEGNIVKPQPNNALYSEATEAPQHGDAEVEEKKIGITFYFDKETYLEVKEALKLMGGSNEDALLKYLEI